jgi:serine/threonine protein kinase
MIPAMPSEHLEKLANQIGSAVALMHDAEIVHGDLTTSNMMIREESGQLVSEVDVVGGIILPNNVVPADRDRFWSCQLPTPA